MTRAFELQGLGVWWRRLRVMTVKEVLQLLRDPVLLFVILYGFTADIYNAGGGVTLQLHQAAVVLQDADHSPASRELASRLQAPEFAPPRPLQRDADVRRALDEGSALLALTVPPRLQADLLAGRPAPVQMQVDATNTALAFLAYSHAAQIVARFGLEQVPGADAANELPMVDNRPRVWFNPNQDDAWFMSISELLNVITAFAILLPAAAMVREKERGTIEQLLVSPLTPLQIMLPKVLAMMGVIHLGIAIAFATVLGPVFHVPVRGSLLLFFAVTLVKGPAVLQRPL